MRVKGSLVTNPITQKLVNEGVIEMYEKKETRTVTKVETGETYEEIAVVIKYRDKRSFTKGFSTRSTKYLKMFEGSPKAQMPFLLDAVLEKFINKDYIYLTYKDFVELCEERGIKVWKQQQFSRMINWFISEGILFRSDEAGKYFYNTELIYNGSLARQLGFEDKDPVEELITASLESKVPTKVSFSNISDTDDDLS